MSRSETSAAHLHAALPVTPASVLLARPRVLAGLGGLLLLAAGAAAIRDGSILLVWDEPIQRGVEASRTSLLDDFFRSVSRLGSQIPVLTMGTLLALATWRRCHAVATALLVATFGRPCIEFVIKALVGRDRPEFERLVPGNGPSFPSGHVLAAVALWGLLPVVVSLYTRRRTVWWASVALSIGLIVAIAASRVYLGVHWFTDVSAGLVVGAFFLLGVEHVLQYTHRRHPCGLLGDGTEPTPADEVDAAEALALDPDEATASAEAARAAAVVPAPAQSA